MTSSEYQQLVALLTRQFTGVDQRFGDVDGRFDDVDRRFDDVDRRLIDVDRRFIEVDRRFAVVERHSSETASQLTALRQDMLGHFDEVYLRFERLEQEYQAITQALRRIEGR